MGNSATLSANVLNVRIAIRKLLAWIGTTCLMKEPEYLPIWITKGQNKQHASISMRLCLQYVDIKDSWPPLTFFRKLYRT